MYCIIVVQVSYIARVVYLYTHDIYIELHGRVRAAERRLSGAAVYIHT